MNQIVVIEYLSLNDAIEECNYDLIRFEMLGIIFYSPRNKFIRYY